MPDPYYGGQDGFEKVSRVVKSVDCKVSLFLFTLSFTLCVSFFTQVLDLLEDACEGLLQSMK